MGRYTISMQLSDDSPLVERFERYKDEAGMESKSEAARQLLRLGLRQELDEGDDPIQEPDAAPDPFSRRGQWVESQRANAFGLAVVAALTLSATFVAMLFFQVVLGWSMSAMPMQVILSVLVVALIGFVVGSLGGIMAHLYLIVRSEPPESPGAEVEA